MHSQMAFRSGPVQCKAGHLHSKSAVLGRPHLLQGIKAHEVKFAHNMDPAARSLIVCVFVGKHARTGRHLTPVQASAVSTLGWS